MSLFYSEISGPASDEQFISVYEDVIGPRLGEAGVEADPWVQARPSPAWVIQGTANFDPVDLLDNALRMANWSATTRFCAALAGFPSPSAKVVTCDMPNNPETVPIWRQRTCRNGHVFNGKHHIQYCVLCGPGMPLS